MQFSYCLAKFLIIYQSSQMKMHLNLSNLMNSHESIPLLLKKSKSLYKYLKYQLCLTFRIQTLLQCLGGAMINLARNWLGIMKNKLSSILKRDLIQDHSLPLPKYFDRFHESNPWMLLIYSFLNCSQLHIKGLRGRDFILLSLFKLQVLKINSKYQCMSIQGLQVLFFLKLLN